MAKRQGEFSTKTKRERLKQSGGFCEAEGPLYGLELGQRCNADLGRGVEFDHFIALGIGGTNDLANARAICVRCHKHKSGANDLPKIAKTKRQSDKSKGIKKPKGTIRNSGFQQTVKEPKLLKKPLPDRKRPLYKAIEK
jgi:5-methylcytosine-specific restriction endonuclease McrA